MTGIDAMEFTAVSFLWLAIIAIYLALVVINQRLSFSCSGNPRSSRHDCAAMYIAGQRKLYL